jgi:hypothetical protein
MGSYKTPSEGGSGGRRGHSNMEHWTDTDEVKAGARLRRRQEDKSTVNESLGDTTSLDADTPLAVQSPTDLVDRLITMIPTFAAHWGDPNNLFRDSVGFTYCGVFSDFSQFLREATDVLNPETIRQLCSLVDECMVDEGSDLENAVGACFLENVAGEPAGVALSPFVNQKARAILSFYA